MYGLLNDKRQSRINVIGGRVQRKVRGIALVDTKVFCRNTLIRCYKKGFLSV